MFHSRMPPAMYILRTLCIVFVEHYASYAEQPWLALFLRVAPGKQRVNLMYFLKY